MAGSKSDFLENELLDHVLGNAAYAAPATVYFGLYSVGPSDVGGGTELTGSGYARIAVTNNATNYPAASGGAKSNGTGTKPVALPGCKRAAHWRRNVPLGKNVRYRVKKTKKGKKVRLAFKNGQVIEAKNVTTGATHTAAGVKRERQRKPKGKQQKGGKDRW